MHTSALSQLEFASLYLSFALIQSQHVLGQFCVGEEQTLIAVNLGTL